MWVYRLIKRNDAETSLTLDTSVQSFYHGTLASPVLFTAAGYASLRHYSSSTTSGAAYGDYIQMKATAAGTQTVVTHRARAYLTAAGIGNAYASHDTLELDTDAGAITGLGCGERGNIVVPNRAVATGTWYGVMAEIYPLGTSAALPANSNACLGISAPTSTAMNAVVNAISFSGADGTGNMIYTHTAAPTVTGYIRILVNGAIRWIPFASAE
jgi:hypothetical protein